MGSQNNSEKGCIYSKSSAVKFLIAACLIVAVSQLQFSSAHTYSQRASEPTQIKIKAKEADKNGSSPHNSFDDRPKRGTGAAAVDDKDQKWLPNTSPSHFHYKVSDNIKGADQFREEKVNNGEVTGYWAVPVDDTGKMWRRTEYRAGKDGFHIVSEKLIPAEEMVGGMKTNADEANVEIEQLGGNTAYTVKGSDLKKPQQPIKRSPFPAGTY